MRVLYLVPQPKREGQLARYSFLNEEIRALSAAGVEAVVLSRATLEERSTRLRASAQALPFVLRRIGAIPTRNLLTRAAYSSYRVECFAADLIRRERIDVIHSHFGWPGGLGGLLARAHTGRPLVASIRGNDILAEASINYGGRLKPFYDRAIRRLLRSADRTIYFSDWMRQQACRLGARADRCRVIRKGVNLAHFGRAQDQQASRTALGFGQRPLLLSVAGLVPRKGIAHILEALAGLKDTHDFSYVVCGEGPQRDDLIALTRRFGLEDRTTFTGRIDRAQMPAYFAACDVFVHAALLEAAGNVLLEAMAAGRPVVCTDAGGPAEYVHHGTTGYVVAVGDVAGLRAYLGRLLDDAALRDRLGAAGQAWALQYADYPRMIKEIVGVYDEVLRTHPARHVAGAR